MKGNGGKIFTNLVMFAERQIVLNSNRVEDKAKGEILYFDMRRPSTVCGLVEKL